MRRGPTRWDVPSVGITRTKSKGRPPAQRAQADDYLEALIDLFPPGVVQRVVRVSGFAQRHRKLDPVFRYTPAFETGPQLQRTL